MSLPFDPIAEARRQWRVHGWGADTPMAAVTSVFRAQQILLARISSVLKPMGLTFARYEVLVLLAASRRGSLPLGLIGERLQVSAASITNAINRLEGSGLVERVAHPTDGRRTLARITEQGRRTVADATTSLDAASFGASGLRGDDAEELIRILGGLRVDAGDVAQGRLGRHAVDPDVENEARARRGPPGLGDVS